MNIPILLQCSEYVGYWRQARSIPLGTRDTSAQLVRAMRQMLEHLPSPPLVLPEIFGSAYSLFRSFLKAHQFSLSSHFPPSQMHFFLYPRARATSHLSALPPLHLLRRLSVFDRRRCHVLPVPPTPVFSSSSMILCICKEEIRRDLKLVMHDVTPL